VGAATASRWAAFKESRTGETSIAEFYQIRSTDVYIVNVMMCMTNDNFK
jgi:hypothetical protein